MGNNPDNIIYFVGIIFQRGKPNVTEKILDFKLGIENLILKYKSGAQRGEQSRQYYIYFVGFIFQSEKPNITPKIMVFKLGIRYLILRYIKLAPNVGSNPGNITYFVGIAFLR